VKILVAPDKFKGCLDARDVAKEIAVGVAEIWPKAQLDVMPIADGGEGTADVISQALGGSWVTCLGHDPLGRQIECRYPIIKNGEFAVIEMSEAAGMRRIKQSELDPLRATTFGVGQMILDAVRRGSSKIIVGLGGSATNDGGFGLARALGFRFFDSDGMQIRSAIIKLRKLKLIEKPGNFTLPPIVGAVDVQNGLLGRRGATCVFGPQKGASRADLALLEKCLKRLSQVAARQVRRFSPRTPGAGAAGGLGFGLIVFAGATLRPGFDIVSEMVGLESRVKHADIVITGEGRLDTQTLSGKGPAGVARLARKHGKRAFAIVGEVRDRDKLGDLFEGVYQLSTDGLNSAGDKALARELLRKRAQDLAKTWQVG
jgi:glycerate kinase